MTDEQVELLKKALSLYKNAILFIDEDDCQRSKFSEMLVELSKLINANVNFWDLYD